MIIGVVVVLVIFAVLYWHHRARWPTTVTPLSEEWLRDQRRHKDLSQ